MNINSLKYYEQLVVIINNCKLKIPLRHVQICSICAKQNVAERLQVKYLFHDIIIAEIIQSSFLYYEQASKEILFC